MCQRGVLFDNSSLLDELLDFLDVELPCSSEQELQIPEPNIRVGFLVLFGVRRFSESILPQLFFAELDGRVVAGEERAELVCIDAPLFGKGVDEAVERTVELVEASRAHVKEEGAVRGSHKEVPVIGHHCAHILVGAQLPVVIGQHVVAVVAAQPIVGTHPDEAILVLRDAADGIGGQAVEHADVAPRPEVGLGGDSMYSKE